MTKPYPHAELIKQAADDQYLEIWRYSHFNSKWQKTFFSILANPENSNVKFAVGEKPTAPPRKMCVMGGIEFPAPESVALEKWQAYWVIGGDDINCFKWGNDEMDEDWLKRGLIHLTESAAQAHWNAREAANKQAIEAAK